jgi:hypothetical protein|tara:strand:- start:1114 stop:1278 length:165 start_codon:yes stop_codon:yes gene_type:complete
MEEVIVEGLDYEDFIVLKEILSNKTSFKAQDQELYTNNLIILEKIEKILQVFNE